MIVSETIPSVLTLSEIMQQVRIEDEGESALLEIYGLAAVEAFERETKVALGVRSIVVTYSVDDIRNNTLWLPKSPCISVTSITYEGGSLTADDWELRKVGARQYLHMYRLPPSPITVTYSAGYSTIPSLVKSALLLHAEHLHRNRGATTSQPNNVVQFGLERVYELYGKTQARIG